MSAYEFYVTNTPTVEEIKSLVLEMGGHWDDTSSNPETYPEAFCHYSGVIDEGNDWIQIFVPITHDEEWPSNLLSLEDYNKGEKREPDTLIKRFHKRANEIWGEEENPHLDKLFSREGLPGFEPVVNDQ